jgi:hypothetical protein
MLVASLLGLLQIQIALGQNIDFDDLRKPGPVLRSDIILPGIGKEGIDIAARFNEIDRKRLEERRQALSANTPVATSPSAAPGPRRVAPVSTTSRFICSFRCTDNRFVLVNEGKAGPLRLSVLALDLGRAREATGTEAKAVCWDQFKLAPKADYFPCRQQ